MGRFCKKPVVIDAILCSDALRLVGDDGWRELPEWFVSAYGHGGVVITEDGIYLPTLEGSMLAQKDDWIIRGVKGELYPCKPDVFTAIYEEEVTNEIMRITRAMWNLFEALNEVKPNDRGPHDRCIAIAISKTEDLIANYCFWEVHQK